MCFYGPVFPRSEIFLTVLKAPSPWLFKSYHSIIIIKEIYFSNSAYSQDVFLYLLSCTNMSCCRILFPIPVKLYWAWHILCWGIIPWILPLLQSFILSLLLCPKSKEYSSICWNSAYSYTFLMSSIFSAPFRKIYLTPWMLFQLCLMCCLYHI